ncbi:MAG: aspartyl/glutamyl-tRNA amidotransferase subunit C [Clostridiaceae bacterium]|nr:aspartyl/glutamyl-tRNA amidotransferase subunit C [Clostridiaceae bacterium]
MTDIDIKWLARLSRIKFSDEELKRMQGDMVSIMELMDSLKSLPAPDDADFGNAAALKELRADEVRESYPPELLVSQSAGRKTEFGEGENFFTIPKIY